MQPHLDAKANSKNTIKYEGNVLLPKLTPNVVTRNKEQVTKIVVKRQI